MKRRKWLPEEKMNIILTCLKMDISVAELCRRHNMYIGKNISSLLSRKPSIEKEREQNQARIAEYEQVIGKLTVFKT
jgi:transposase-like protein